MSGEEVESGEELVYDDLYPPPPPPPPLSTQEVGPQVLPTGDATDYNNDDEPPKKKCLTKFNICVIISFVIMTIVLAVTLSQPGALSAFGKEYPNEIEGMNDERRGPSEPTDIPTYWPTYSPTVAETYSPTVAETEADEGDNIIDNVTSTTVATEAVVTTTNATTTTTTTTTTTATTTTILICNFNIQYKLKAPNSTYAFTYQPTKTIYSSLTTNATTNLILDQEYKETNLCIPVGEYELQTSAGVCVTGFLGKEEIFYSCAESVIVVEVED